MPRSLNFLFRVAVSALLLYLVARKVPIEAFLHSLTQVSLVPMFASYLLIPIMGYIDANRTKVMTDLQGMTLSVNQIVRISFITSFYSLFLPGYLAGGVIRWHRMSRHDKMPAQALATIIFARLLATIVSVAVGLLCWFADAHARKYLGYGAMLAALLLGLMAGYWLLFMGKRAGAIAAWVPNTRWVPQIIKAKLVKLLDSAGRFDQMHGWRLVSTVALLVCSEIIGIASFWLISYALHLGLSPVSIGWIRAYIALITLLPVSVMGIGVREGSLVLMLHAYGIAPAIAVTYSLLLLTRTIAIGLLGGACELWNILMFKENIIAGRS